jgi:hypothetical protein
MRQYSGKRDAFIERRRRRKDIDCPSVAMLFVNK